MTGQHLNEEDLVLYYYGEPGRDHVAEHLARCGDCRANYRTLQQVLNHVEEEPPPERGPDYGGHVWRRLQPSLPYRGWRCWLPGVSLGRVPNWAFAAAMAGMLLVAFLAGRQWPSPSVTAGISVAARERILLVAVGEHLERSQMVLVELVNAPEQGTVDLSGEQKSAEDLLAANRLYRQTAARQGDAGLASVLEELERVLLELAHSDAQVSGESLRPLRERIERHGTLFKIRVLGERVREAPQRRQESEGRG